MPVSTDPYGNYTTLAISTASVSDNTTQSTPDVPTLETTSYEETTFSITAGTSTTKGGTELPPTSNNKETGIILGVVIPVLLIAIAAVIVVVCIMRRRRRKKPLLDEKQPKVFKKEKKEVPENSSPLYVNTESPYYSEASNKLSLKKQDSDIYDEVKSHGGSQKIVSGEPSHTYLEIIDSEPPKTDAYYIDMNKGTGVEYSRAYGGEYTVPNKQKTSPNVKPAEKTTTKLTPKEKDDIAKQKLGLGSSVEKETFHDYENYPKKPSKTGWRKFLPRKKSKDVIGVESVKQFSMEKQKKEPPSSSDDSDINIKTHIPGQKGQSVNLKVLDEGENYENLSKRSSGEADEKVLSMILKDNDERKLERLSDPIHDNQYYVNVSDTKDEEVGENYMNLPEKLNRHGESDGEDYENVNEKLKPSRKT